MTPDQGTASDGGVSVVVATYNGERHLREQLESVLVQTLQPVEVIVCDDGSSDGTLDVVEELLAGAPVPIRVVRNDPRLGFSDNFLNGASLATGRYVAFCDQDDRWRPDKLQVGRAALVEHDAVLCAHAVELIDDRGEHLGTDDQGIGSTRVLEPLSGDPWQKYFGFTLLFERRLLDVIPYSKRGPDTHTLGSPLSHDRWVCFLGLSLGRAVVLHDTLAGYRQHGAQLYGSQERRVGRLARARNVARHFSSSVRGVHERSAFLSHVCAQRAELLATADGFDRRILDQAAERWRRLGEHYRSRAGLHEDVSPLSRMRALVRVARAGGYVPYERGGLGRRALVQDIGACSGAFRMRT
jgi:hypothetical protein